MEPLLRLPVAPGPSLRRRLLFVSPRFLFPMDNGGKIRTVQILRGMKGGAWEITLASPVPPDGRTRFAAELSAVCDRFASWPEPRRGRAFRLTRMRHLVSRFPVPVATDRSDAGRRVVAAELAGRPDVVVFDFLHSTVLAPAGLAVPSVLFTHNVESEIFRRHADLAENPVKKAVFRDQLRKMERFEGDALRRFQTVVAVSERDAGLFRESFGLARAEVIPTGVDVDFFSYTPPGESQAVAFTGSMDWLANIDGVDWFLDQVWDRVVREVPGACFKVIGRNPPDFLVEKARAKGLPWDFTGFVDDVRPHVRGCSAYVIPLRVGGGTRLKAFEAMAMGCPVVSTSIGVEGLPVEPDLHYLRADTAPAFASALVRLLREAGLRERMAREARRHMEESFSFLRVARTFEDLCLRAAEGEVTRAR
ncbi:MAG TPA: glycosyltransferase [Thermoanaerobaculia bacterium]|nr:glycosyltransferase [Thermoanaerobaculia bacterium]